MRGSTYTPPVPDAEAIREPEKGAARSRLALLAGIVVLTGAIVWASLIGEAGSIGTLASVVYLLVKANALPVLYVAGAIGFGVPLQRWLLPGAESVWSVRTALGLAAALTITHLLGITGLIFVQWIAFGVPIVGAAMLALELRRIEMRDVRLSVGVPWVAAMPAIGVMLVAACSPPGWLWSSEAGGYDVVSYHLQLTRDWIELGRIWPVEHNVYSYLPGYLEAAYTQIIVGMGKGDSSAAMIEGSGEALIACQLLHAFIAIIAAALTGTSARLFAERIGLDENRSRICGAVAGALVIATPWVVVTGSMAYNEMGVIALFAGAMIVALVREISPVRRGLVAGLLVGAACGCKPTAILFVAPVIGLAFFWFSPRHVWVRLGVCASIGGAMMLAPWLVRNTLAGGNPVFPQLTGVFGSAHWSAEQAQRYAGGHTFEGGVLDALRLIVLPDPADPMAGMTGRGVHRGLMHPQWSIWLPLTLGALAVLIVRPRTRRVSVFLILALGAQLGAWLVFTHIQSRFLMPMLVPMALAVSLACASLTRRLAVLVGSVCALSLGLSTLMVYAREQARFGGPASAIVWGAKLFTTPGTESTNPRDLSPTAYINTALPDEARVLLVGSATPMYLKRDVLYATTWDASVFAEAIRAADSEDPEGVSRAVDERFRALGVTHVYVDRSELARLETSGWLDPVLGDDIVIGILTRLGRKTDVGGQDRHLVYELR